MKIQVEEGDKNYQFQPFYRGKPLKSFDIEHSRPIYTLKSKGEIYLVKFDYQFAYRDDRDPSVYHQSSFEYDMYFNEIAESDKWAFLELVDGKMIPQQECGRGYIVQRYVPELENSCIPEDWHEAMWEIINRYELTDIDMPDRNCGYLESEEQAVIYDWGCNSRLDSWTGSL